MRRRGSFAPVCGMNVPVMSPHALRVGLLVAVLAGTTGCGAGSHTGAGTAGHGGKVAGVPVPGLQGKIVFRRFFDAAHSHGALFVMNADGTGVRQVTHPPADAVDSLNGPPSATRDGPTVVFDRSTADAAGIFRIHLDGSGEQEVPAPSGVPGDGWPAVSPDGTRIAVARAWGKQDGFDDLKTGLYVLRIDGTHPKLVASLGYRADVGGATWSPDGKTLIFSARNNGPGTPSNGSALFAVDVTGRGLHRITPWDTEHQISGPVLSPDGSTILFRLEPQNQDFGGDYFTLTRGGKSRRRLTHFGPAHTTGSATWSPDGSMIVFADAGMGGNDDLYVMRADGTSVRRLTRTPQWESAATWLGP
jgi:TolB protein